MNIDFDNMQSVNLSTLGDELKNIDKKFTSIRLCWKLAVGENLINGAEVGEVLNNLPSHITDITFIAYCTKVTIGSDNRFDFISIKRKIPDAQLKGLLGNIGKNITSLTIDAIINNEATSKSVWANLPSNITEITFISMTLSSALIASLPSNITTLELGIEKKIDLSSQMDNTSQLTNPFIKTLYLRENTYKQAIVSNEKKLFGTLFPNVEQVFLDNRAIFPTYTRKLGWGIVDGSNPIKMETTRLINSYQLSTRPPSLTKLSARKVAETTILKLEKTEVIDSNSKKSIIQKNYLVGEQYLPNEIAEKIMFFKPKVVTPTFGECLKKIFSLSTS